MFDKYQPRPRDGTLPNHYSGGSTISISKEIFAAWRDLYDRKLVIRKFPDFIRNAAKTEIERIKQEIQRPTIIKTSSPAISPEAPKQ